MSTSHELLTEGLLGAAPSPGGGVRFRVWAPFAGRVEVEADGRRTAMRPEDRGYHSVVVEGAEVGSRYGFVLDGREPVLPDPASRSQPDGVHGLSAVVGPTDPPPLWRGPGLADSVVSELHVGTASDDGTFDGLVGYVEELAAVGVNAVELMPVAQFPGRRNWGYDGVFPYAVQDSYGGPEGLRRFVAACHERGVAVVLDVVLNHIGPEGNVLPRFGPYFTDRYRTPWGEAVNYDGPGSDEVRRFFGGSALSWLEDFGVDALRLDAVHGIVDTTARPFLLELAEAVGDVRERTGRRTLLVAETNLNDVRLITDLSSGGIGMDGQWNDDFHHALHALLTGERTGYYADFGTMRDLADTIQGGYAYRGRHSPFYDRRQGSESTAVAPQRFVVFAQNHDQVGNRMAGDRLSMLVSFEALKVAAGLTLLHPGVPLLFQGEEYGEAAPFPYFVDHSDPELVEAVRRGRREEFASFGWAGEPPDPQDEETFRSARLDRGLARSGRHAVLLAWHRELLRTRRETPALRGGVPAETETDEARRLLSVWREEGGCEALLVANLGPDPAADALPTEAGWRLELHSADARWDGPGVPSGGALPPESLALLIRGNG